jgi:hypothetical protein
VVLLNQCVDSDFLQERAKKQFSIFNPVEDAMTEDTLHAEEERFEHKVSTD